eukprot:gene23997-32402_t
MSITSDEVNFLVYRYLQENGFSHSAFTFAYESLVVKSSVAQTVIPPGALITFLQKGLEYIAIEEHINEDGSVQEFENNYSLLCPLICDAVAVKEDRRIKKPNTSSSIAAPLTQAAGYTDSNGVLHKADGAEPMDQSHYAPNGEEGRSQSNGSSLQPSTINLFYETTGSRYLKLSGHQAEVFMCQWSPTQNQLATGSGDGVCRLWGLGEMTEDKWKLKSDVSIESQFVSVSTAILPHSSTQGEKYKDVTSITWSPDGQYIATGCYDGLIRVWESSGKLHMLLREHTGPVFSLKWSRSQLSQEDDEGALLLSGSYDQRVIIWSTKTGSVVKAFKLHSGPVLDVDWKDGDYFATCSSDMTIQICQVSAVNLTKSTCTLTGHTDEINALCWSPGGQFLASCSDDTTAKIWTLESGLMFDLKGHSKEIFNLKWTPTGPHSVNSDKPLFLCTASFDGTVKVWSATSGEIVYNLCKKTQPVYSLSTSPNGAYLVTGSLGGNVAIWSLANGDLLKECQGTGDTFDVSWSRDGSLLCACFSSGNINNSNNGQQFNSSYNDNSNFFKAFIIWCKSSKDELRADGLKKYDDCPHRKALNTQSRQFMSSSTTSRTPTSSECCHLSFAHNKDVDAGYESPKQPLGALPLDDIYLVDSNLWQNVFDASSNRRGD